jgi:hypothetical protein
MSRLCKYHGRACEFPGACLNRAPRKYEGDGHMETIDPERLTIGCVVRSPGPNGALHSFSDTVVTGIHVSYSKHGPNQKKVDKEHFLTLKAALDAAHERDYVVVSLAAPLMYADNVFGSMPGWALKCSTYDVMSNQLLNNYKVVVMSTGEYDTRNVKTPFQRWEVVVTNVDGGNETGWAPKDGKVYSDFNEGGARESYKIHRQMAQGAYGRKGGETVTLTCGGEVVEQYVGDMG